MTNTYLNTEYLNELKDLEAMKKELDEQIKAMKGQVKAEMRSLGVKSLMVGDIKVTYSEYASVTLDTKRIKNELPEVYEEFGKVTNGERLTVK